VLVSRCRAKWIGHKHSYIPSFLDFLPIQVTTEHWIEFPVLYNRFSLIIYFMHSINHVYMSISISQFIPPFPRPLGSHTVSFFWGGGGHTLQPEGTLVPWPGIEPMSLVLGVESLNHWTTREALTYFYGGSEIASSLLKWKWKSLQSCPTLCDPMDYSPPGPSVHGILQARILEWVAMPFSISLMRHWYISLTTTTMHLPVWNILVSTDTWDLFLRGLQWQST